MNQQPEFSIVDEPENFVAVMKMFWSVTSPGLIGLIAYLYH
jgi:hypothetical protein